MCFDSILKKNQQPQTKWENIHPFPIIHLLLSSIRFTTRLAVVQSLVFSASYMYLIKKKKEFLTSADHTIWPITIEVITLAIFSRIYFSWACSRLAHTPSTNTFPIVTTYFCTVPSSTTVWHVFTVYFIHAAFTIFSNTSCFTSKKEHTNHMLEMLNLRIM